MTGNAFNPWLLEDTDSIRQRYTKSDVKRGQTELIQCRADSFHVRRVDEIVASRIEPSLKTRSDVLQDALALWLEDWDKRNPDGATGELSYQARLEKLERRQRYRQEFIERAEDQLKILHEVGDIHALREYLELMILAYSDFKSDAPPRYMAKMEGYINDARRLLADH